MEEKMFFLIEDKADYSDLMLLATRKSKLQHSTARPELYWLVGNISPAKKLS